MKKMAFLFAILCAGKIHGATPTQGNFPLSCWTYAVTNTFEIHGNGTSRVDDNFYRGSCKYFDNGIVNCISRVPIEGLLAVDMNSYLLGQSGLTRIYPFKFQSLHGHCIGPNQD